MTPDINLVLPRPVITRFFALIGTVAAHLALVLMWRNLPHHAAHAPVIIPVPVVLGPVPAPDYRVPLNGEALAYTQTKIDHMVKNAGHQVPHCRLCNLAGGDFHAGFLRNAAIEWSDLRGANLSARLDLAWLIDADMTDAKLTHANLNRLPGAWGLKLVRADARGATFRYAYLFGVDFTGTDLSGADLRNTRGLTNRQLVLACGDKETQLPPGIVLKPCGQSVAR